MNHDIEITQLDLVAGGNVIRQGHHFTLDFTPRGENGDVIALTGKDIYTVFYDKNGIRYEGAASYISSDAVIRVEITENIGHGTMWIEFTATDPNDAAYKKKFPARENNARISITPSTDDLSFVGVKSITVEQLRNEQAVAQQEFESEVLPRVETVESQQAQLAADYQAAAGALTEDSEVILARGDKPTLGARLDDTAVKLAETADDVEVINNYGLSIESRGASPTKTDAENKAILQETMTYLDSIGGGLAIVPPHISYGYNRNVNSTHPDFSGIQTNVIVNDFSKGKTYSGDLQRDGAQIRTFYKTSGIETDGFHDGNGHLIRAQWHPYYMIMNDGISGQTNNRRVTYWMGNNGEVCWGVGQGNNSVEGGTDDELSAFKIVGNRVAGGIGLESFYTILKTNGYHGWGVQNPLNEYHFNLKRGSHGEFALRRSIAGNMRLLMETLTKKRRIELYEADGTIKITNVGNTANVMELTDAGNAKFSQGVNGSAFTTATRPTVPVGTMVYDTTMDKPIWRGNTAWVDNLSRYVNKPLTMTDPGSKGDWSADSTHLYICHATNTWKRIPMQTW